MPNYSWMCLVVLATFLVMRKQPSWRFSNSAFAIWRSSRKKPLQAEYVKKQNKEAQKKNLKFPLLQMQMWKFREGKYKKKPYHILNIFAPFSAEFYVVLQAYPSFRHTLTLLLFLKTLKAKMEIWIYVVVELLNPETEYGLPQMVPATFFITTVQNCPAQI